MLTAPWHPEGSLGVRNFRALGFRVQGVFPSALLWVSSVGRYGTRKATNYTETRNLLQLCHTSGFHAAACEPKQSSMGPLIFLAWITITITCRASSDDSRATRTLLPWSLISEPEKNEASVRQA